MAVCDRDGLRCKHPDCILDEPPDDKERQELDRIDRELCPRSAKAQRSKERYHSDPEYRARCLRQGLPQAVQRLPPGGDQRQAEGPIQGQKGGTSMTDRAAWTIRWCTGDRDDPEVRPWHRERAPDQRARRRWMWLHAEPIRCKHLIRVLRWCYYNRLELLMLALCVLALVSAEWAAKLLVRHI